MSLRVLVSAAMATALVLIGTTTIRLIQSASTEDLDQSSGGTSSSLPSDDDAVARFRELHTIALRSATDRDHSLLGLAFTATSPARERASNSIRMLTRNKVLDRSSVEFIRIEVVDKSSTEMKILAISHAFPCFKTERGRDVTKGPPAIEQETIWTLRYEGAQWLIHDAQLQEDRVLRNEDARCQ